MWKKFGKVTEVALQFKTGSIDQIPNYINVKQVHAIWISAKGPHKPLNSQQWMYGPADSKFVPYNTKCHNNVRQFYQFPLIPIFPTIHIVYNVTYLFITNSQNAAMQVLYQIITWFFVIVWLTVVIALQKWVQKPFKL